MSKGRLLGLDFGQVRIGVAVSDALGIIAQARGRIEYKDLKHAVRQIAEWVSKEKAVKVVLGLPINMDDSMGPKAQEVLAFKQILEDQLSVPIVTWDERMTSRQAESVLIEADMSRKKRKEKIDSLAAQMILQGYLDSEKGEI